MSEHLLRDLEHLKREILAMGGMVEESINLAITAVVDRRPDLAEQVLRGDDDIDARELEVEDECLKVLALHQPVAGDLRFIVAVMKVNNDLERMGDLALNIAERAQDLAQVSPVEEPAILRGMAERVRQMVQQSLDALVRQDAGLARKVCEEDAAVDEQHRNRFVELQRIMKSDPERVEGAVQLLSVSRYLERIADHATNIAEDVVFMAEGKVIRHSEE